MCCFKAKVDWPFLARPPDPLRSLITARGVRGRTFRSQIRVDNSALCLGSPGANAAFTDSPSAGGAYTFHIRGSPRHRSGSHWPPCAYNPAFAQICFADSEPQEDAAMRRQWTHAALPQLVAAQSIIHEENPNCVACKSNIERTRE